MNCTTETCDQPTDLYLCGTCVAELHETMLKIADLIPTLWKIARRQEPAFTNRADRGGGAGPSAPMNLAALALAHDLIDANSKPAQEYARAEDGAAWKARIEDQVKRADIMVNGEDERAISPAYVAYKMKQVAPMTVPVMVPWLAEAMKVKLTAARIHKWAQRGKITRTNNNGDPTYHPADVLRAHQESRAKL